ncbi:polysaccharide deacetylase family protein [Saccharothrix coeruleofusca]|uniref:Chitooligosaccharide deacetylase n=1 Tax=Saccharothrix coeruleofusca TaxID=33919 RepID=A0A918EE39_9PSEU|nr:polysaccharide deacetylase family protein [Saccharothrix coeruleofusca]GGP62763.1 chitooligosaccharide deacetylase [Saccharothrix coeruleofusca]
MRFLPTNTRARRLVFALAVVVVLTPLCGLGLWRLAGARTFQFYGGLVSSVETSAKVVALTFDDGPDPAGARRTLDELAAREVPATFYLTGHELAAHPELGRAVAEAGHEIGNHSFSHDRMVFVTPGRVADEVERTDELIRATGYRGPITFRPPNGKKLLVLPRYLDQHGRTTVMWDVEPNSYPEVDRSAEATARHVVDNARPGSIVLLHSMYQGRQASRDAIGPIVDRLRERGYRFVTVSELLAMGPPR